MTHDSLMQLIIRAAKNNMVVIDNAERVIETSRAHEGGFGVGVCVCIGASIMAGIDKKMCCDWLCIDGSEYNNRLRQFEDRMLTHHALASIGFEKLKGAFVERNMFIKHRLVLNSISVKENWGPENLWTGIQTQRS